MTKDDIIQNALNQFLLNGIRKMTIQQIIAPLGISTKTVYKHFNSKEELLEACLVIHYGKMTERFKSFSVLNKDPLSLLFYILFKSLEEDFNVAPAFYHDLNYFYPEIQDKVIARYHEIYEHLSVNTIKNGTDEGLFRPEINGAIVLEALQLLYRSITRSWQYDKYNLTPFELAANTLVVYLRGICTEKGIKIIDNLKP